MTELAERGRGPVGELGALDPVLRARLVHTLERGQAPETVRAYGSSWQRFTGWCDTRKHRGLPADPATVAGYLVDAAETLTEDGQRAYSPATLARWAAAIGWYHRAAGAPSPTDTELVRRTLSGIRRSYAAAGARPPRRVRPLLTADVATIVAAARRDTDGWVSQVFERRDTAMLLTQYAGALRRSSLVALTVETIVWHPVDGVHLRIRRSKTDQEGRGRVLALPYGAHVDTCPPCALRRWLDVLIAHHTSGRPAVIRALRDAPPLAEHVCSAPCPSIPRDLAGAPVFRPVTRGGQIRDTALSGAAVHERIRRRATLAGYPDDIVAQLGGHSPRAGFVTQAFRNGQTSEQIARQTDHASAATVELYRREHAPLLGNAATELGL
ncbi:integrase [Rhodococcus rhodnii]|uniref:integrase n=1 Tax=Rhodococcus rhodnii TaxID=38312 RepID=UPI000A8B37A2|nr:integrase [Rhodococcus rhodnii]